jgi:hypothetical protein
LQNDYDHLFIDDGVNFKFTGFQNLEDKIIFQKRVSSVIDEIKDERAE